MPCRRSSSIASHEHEIEVRDWKKRGEQRAADSPQTLLMGLFFYMSCFLTGWSQTVVLFVNKSCIYKILQWNRSEWLHILKWLSFCSGLSVLVSRSHSHENLFWVHHVSYFTPHMLDSVSSCISCLFIKTDWIHTVYILSLNIYIYFNLSNNTQLDSFSFSCLSLTLITYKMFSSYLWAAHFS